MGVKSVASPAGEDKPTGVDAPVMVAVGIGTVGTVQREAFTRLQVHHPQVAFLVPDGEVPVIHEGKHQILAVVGRTWPRQADDGT